MQIWEEKVQSPFSAAAHTYLALKQPWSCSQSGSSPAQPGSQREEETPVGCLN